MTTSLGVPTSYDLIGSGNSFSVSGIPGPSIDLTSLGITPYNMAYSLPRDSILTSIAAFFAVNTVNLGADTVTIRVQIYQSSTPDNIFTPIIGAQVILTPSITGSVPAGTPLSGVTTGLNIPMTIGTRFLYLIFASSGGINSTNTITGYVSGGLNFQ